MGLHFLCGRNRTDECTRGSARSLLTKQPALRRLRHLCSACRSSGRCPGTPPAGGAYAAGTPSRRAARSSFRTPLASPAPGGASFRTPPPNPRLLAGVSFATPPAPPGISRRAGDIAHPPDPRRLSGRGMFPRGKYSPPSAERFLRRAADGECGAAMAEISGPAHRRHSTACLSPQRSFRIAAVRR